MVAGFSVRSRELAAPAKQIGGRFPGFSFPAGFFLFEDSRKGTPWGALSAAILLPLRHILPVTEYSA